MEKEMAQELMQKIEETNTKLGRIADSLVVFKVAAIAFIIAGLIVTFANFIK